MTDGIERARREVRRASDLTDDETVREQLRSIDEGLMELTHGDEAGDHPASTRGDVPRGGDLRDVEAKLAGLGDAAEGTPRALIQDARDRIDDYRRQYPRDW